MRSNWRAWIGLMVLVAALTAFPASASAQGNGKDGPDITQAPSITGIAQVGMRLDAVGAAWRGRGPTSASYSWRRCATEAAGSCNFIADAEAPSYTVTADDLGRRLRVLLVVSDRHGRSSALSAPTAPVVAAPVVVPVPLPLPAPFPLPAPPPLAESVPVPATALAPKVMKPAPVVRIQGYLTRRGARITALTVRAPKGARIATSCTGVGCPRAAARAVKVTRLWSYEGMLRAGVRIVIRVTRPGYIGKHTTIRIRRGKAPARTDLCLYPGAKAPSACPAA